jgi:hypothetical protein
MRSPGVRPATCRSNRLAAGADRVGCRGPPAARRASLAVTETGPHGRCGGGPHRSPLGLFTFPGRTLGRLIASRIRNLLALRQVDPRAGIVAAWTGLPETDKSGFAAMLKAAVPSTPSRSPDLPGVKGHRGPFSGGGGGGGGGADGGEAE